LVNKMAPSVNEGRWPADQKGFSQLPLVVLVQLFSAKDGVIAAAQKARETAERAARKDLMFIAGKLTPAFVRIKWGFAHLDSDGGATLGWRAISPERGGGCAHAARAERRTLPQIS